MSTDKSGGTIIRYHSCSKRPPDSLFETIEWRNGQWQICELRGGVFAVFVPIKTIEDSLCPWCKLQLPNLEKD